MESYIKFLNNYSDKFLQYIANQFELIILVTVISLILWVPLGIFLVRHRKYAQKVMTVANFIYCTPSLALFVIFMSIPFLGIGRTSALVAMVLYSMMPLVRNVYVGISGVDKTVIEAAKGMGLNKNQILKKVQLPLAMPVMFAGFRTTVIMTTGMSTIAVFIGEKNLGQFIFDGMNRHYMEMLIVGSVSLCIISLVMDYILAFCEKKMVPKGLRVGRN
ncbi:ABC transporter permease [Candidatus Formimonas warabiya]|uniref:ABC transporter permease n=1 Tax=Formimonas warabiya TaxID=1761012 RepID=UPI001F3C56D7|nr:ABC transporter permease [Candidatus Formimonas warabiya]